VWHDEAAIAEGLVGRAVGVKPSDAELERRDRVEETARRARACAPGDQDFPVALQGRARQKGTSMPPKSAVTVPPLPNARVDCAVGGETHQADVAGGGLEVARPCSHGS
jgi:hypothetical protein